MRNMQGIIYCSSPLYDSQNLCKQQKCKNWPSQRGAVPRHRHFWGVLLGTLSKITQKQQTNPFVLCRAADRTSLAARASTCRIGQISCRVVCKLVRKPFGQAVSKEDVWILNAHLNKTSRTWCSTIHGDTGLPIVGSDARRFGNVCCNSWFTFHQDHDDNSLTLLFSQYSSKCIACEVILIDGPYHHPGFGSAFVNFEGQRSVTKNAPRFALLNVTLMSSQETHRCLLTSHNQPSVWKYRRHQMTPTDWDWHHHRIRSTWLQPSCPRPEWS